MESIVHSMSDLFDQLGLPSDDQSIDEFIAKHQVQDSRIPIEELGIWSPAQADFLREARLEDADWAEVVDELSAALHNKKH